MSERLSILLVNHNRTRYLKAALKTIMENTVNPYELLIYDNASNRKDVRFLQRFEKEAQVPVKVWYGQENIGVWRASNILIANASSRETLGFIKCDNDIVVRTKGWDQKWIDVANEVPEVGVVAANAENINRRNSHITPIVQNGHRLLQNHDYGTGVCVFWPGRTFKQLGFYEEQMGCMGHGDKLVEVRCRAINKWFVYDEDVTVDRQRPGRRDHYGGYRSWKNRYVKNNRPVFESIKSGYLDGTRSPAIWYEKFKHAAPADAEFTSDSLLVDWNTGKPLK